MSTEKSIGIEAIFTNPVKLVVKWLHYLANGGQVTVTKTIDKKLVGQRIKLAREKMGLNQDELARIVGYTAQSGLSAHASISMIEAGKMKRLDCDVINLIAQAVNHDVLWLLGLDTPDLEDPELEAAVKSMKGWSPTKRQAIIRIMRELNMIEDEKHEPTM